MAGVLELVGRRLRGGMSGPISIYQRGYILSLPRLATYPTREVVCPRTLLMGNVGADFALCFIAATEAYERNRARDSNIVNPWVGPFRATELGRLAWSHF